MAVHRQPYLCPRCGEQIQEVHMDQTGRDPMHMFVGDTFLRYDTEGHACKAKDNFAEKIQEGVSKTI